MSIQKLYKVHTKTINNTYEICLEKKQIDINRNESSFFRITFDPGPVRFNPKADQSGSILPKVHNPYAQSGSDSA